MYRKETHRCSLGLAFLVVSLGLVATLALWGCGNTDGGEADDQSFGDDVFVSADGVTGKIEITVPDRVAVGSTDNFSAKVTDVDGAAVPAIQVSCDSERGIAIIEPTTGTELTDSFGGISGVVGCRFPGSFQFGCRLPIGANKRKFKTIHCEGDIPSGFSGFPDAAGGGIGTGGVSVGDDGEPGGDGIDGVRVASLEVFDVSTNATFGVDVEATADCNGDGTADDPEPFVQNLVCATLENNNNQQVEIVNMRFTVDNVDGTGTGDYTSPNIRTGVEVDPNGGTVEVCAPFTSFNSSGDKVFVGRTTEIAELFRNITFRYSVRNQSGDTGSVSIGTGIDFQNFNNCT